MPRKGYKQTEEHKRKRSEKMSGEYHHQWKGGRVLTSQGYVWVRSYGHPSASKKGHYVLEHRIIMENILSRYLRDDEVVHHRNHNVSDNRIENLELMSAFEHNRQHHIGKRTKLRGNYIYTFI